MRMLAVMQCSPFSAIVVCILLTKVFYQDGRTPVYIASYNGHTDLVDLLVEAGADIHLAETKVYIYLVHTGSCVLSI